MLAVSRFVLVGAVVAAAALSGCGEQGPEALLASAKEHLAKKESRSAVIQLKSALQARPSMTEARFLLGRTLLDSGDALSAEVELRKAAEANYDPSAVTPLLASSLLLEGKASRVIQDYAAVRLADPAATADLKTTLAVAYAQRSDLDAARSSLDEALRLAPGRPASLRVKARLASSDHRFDDALTLLAQALAADPSDYEALQLEGDLLFFAKNDADGAIRVQRRALDLRKDWLPSHVSLIEILLARNDVAGAQAQFEQLRQLLPNHPQTKYFAARFAMLKPDYATARALAQQLLSIDPDNVRFLSLATVAELHGGSLVQAEAYAAKALRQAPDAVLARSLLARVQLRSGDPAKARDTLAPMLAASKPAAGVLSLAAEIALQTGDTKTAEDYFSQAAALDPHDTRARAALALGQIAKGNRDLGFAQLIDVAAADKGTSVDLAIVGERLRAHDFDGTLRAIDAIERKQPNKPDPYQLRGQVLAGHGDYGGARASFERSLAIDPLYFPAAVGLASLDMLEQKPVDAVARFDRLLSADPKNARALLAVAELRSQSGAPRDEVTRLLTKAIAADPTAVDSRLVLIELDLRVGDASAALTAAQDAVAALPSNSRLLDALGRARMAVGDTHQALDAFNKAAAVDPRSPLPQIRLAEMHASLRDMTAARASLERALAIAPTYLPANRALILLDITSNRSDSALQQAHALQGLLPEQNSGSLLAGDVQMAANRPLAAAAEYRDGLRREASAILAIKLHNALVAGRKSREAAAFADEWLESHPQDSAFHSYLGDRLLAANEYAAAEPHYLSVIGREPRNAVALNNLAWVTFKLKKPGALAYANKAVELQPKQAAFQDTLATVLADSGRSAQAIAAEKAAVALAPDQPGYRLALAKLYLQTGDKRSAQPELVQLAKLGDKFPGQAEVGALLRAY